MRPARTPIGLELARAARTVSRAFDDALAEAGGSLPVWLVLLNLKTRHVSSQRELAEAVGVREATLTHHLNAMGAQGLVTRTRDPAHPRRGTDAGWRGGLSAAAGRGDRLRPQAPRRPHRRGPRRRGGHARPAGRKRGGRARPRRPLAALNPLLPLSPDHAGGTALRRQNTHHPGPGAGAPSAVALQI